MTDIKPFTVDMWTDALRSGEYKQGKAFLHTTTISGDDRYCCLGVLCDLAVKAGVPIDVSYASNVVAYDEMGGLPPASVNKWANISIFGSLANRNDRGDSFEEIADYIEACPKYVFEHAD